MKLSLDSSEQVAVDMEYFDGESSACSAGTILESSALTADIDGCVGTGLACMLAQLLLERALCEAGDVALSSGHKNTSMGPFVLFSQIWISCVGSGTSRRVSGGALMATTVWSL